MLIDVENDNYGEDVSLISVKRLTTCDANPSRTSLGMIKFEVGECENSSEIYKEINIPPIFNSG